MIFIEFKPELQPINTIRYRNVTDDEWHYMEIDIQTLSVLLYNYGVISTLRLPDRFTNCDNPSTSRTMNLKFGGADIQLYAKNKSDFNLALIEQPY